MGFPSFLAFCPVTSSAWLVVVNKFVLQGFRFLSVLLDGCSFWS